MGHPRPEGGKPRGGPAGVASGPPPKPALKQEEGMPAGGTHGPARSPADPRSYTGCPGPNGREDVLVAAEGTACGTSWGREGRAPRHGSRPGATGRQAGGREAMSAHGPAAGPRPAVTLHGPSPLFRGSQAWEGLRQQLL
ncbi:unnamed protein product [Rangifer tarandus platyrhynchus]|uniref:Uncharacterized protein n=1 Tax=Rangifer tarandus platyrhynchus TaxID=3082113 RepID=A0ABN9A3N6_RANTA|nr:unnamed protein product [Rangifer tarandus platyrhynchus]